MNITNNVREICLEQLKECQNSEIEFQLPWLPFLQNLTASASNKWAAQIKEFGSHIKKLKWNDVKKDEVEILSDFLPKLFIAIDPKEPGCRAVVGILQSVPLIQHGHIVNKMADQLGNTITTAQSTDREQIQNVLAVFRAHLENFSLGEECVKLQIMLVLKFLAESLEILVSSSRSENSAVLQTQAMHQCLVLVKTGLTVIQKCSSTIIEKIEKKCEVIISSLEALLRLLATILKTDTFLADCRSAAGMMFALICKTWCPSGSHLVNLVTSTLCYHPNIPSAVESSHLHQLLLTFDLYKSAPGLSRLYLCHGFLVMLEPRDLVQDLGQGKTVLLDVLFPEIYQLTECLANSSTSLPAARTLCQWVDVTEMLLSKVESSHVKSALAGPSPISQKLLQYVTTHWDHPIDGIRHQTKSIFEGVMKIHVKTLNGVSAHQDPFTLDTLSTLLSTDRHTRGKYGPLGCIFEMVGASHVINLCPGVLPQLLAVMGEHAMATHSCEVIERLFNEHKRELQQTDDKTSLSWNETWVIPILNVLSDQTKPRKQKGFIIDYLIPKLLKCSPPSLAFIIQHLSSQPPSHAPRTKGSDPSPSQHLTDDNAKERSECSHGNQESSSSNGGRLGALLSCLKTARSLGLLKSGQDVERVKKEKKDEAMDVRRKEDEKKEDEEVRLWKGLVPVRLLYQALSHSIDQIRIDAIGLLCDSKKTTEDVTDMDLSLLTFSLTLNLNNPSPSFRQQLISHIKKLLVRLRESGRILSKKSHEARDQLDHYTRLLPKYQDFLEWLSTVMFHSLEPGFGYASRATSLQVLTAIHVTFPSSNNGLFDISTLWSTSRVNLMVVRLTDNYESNRVMAFDLLASLPQATLGLQNPRELQDCYRVACDLAISNKPYNCETAAYVFRLLVRQKQPSLNNSLSKETTKNEALENHSQPRLDARSSIEANTLWVIQDLCDTLARQVEVARESLLEAAVQGPMYGVLHCLRILLGDTDLKTLPMIDQWRCVMTRLIQLCFDVADVAATVVCNSSPEGFIPSEQKQVIEEESSSQSSQCQQQESGAMSQLETFHVTPQMILVCCWRSMKEVSLLLGELSQRAPMEDGDKEGLVTSLQVKSIGTFFMKLLRESKHRGAFELAYAGFIKLTTRIWSEPSSIHGLPQQWLSELLQEITSNQSMLCATRRSAGIPFAIQALIGPEPKELGKPCFQNTMTTLLTLALPSSQNQDHTAQVHALNILRALFHDTKLGQEVLPFIGDGVKAAILGFAAKLWAVRNSATMLFSALISRIFGVKRARDELARKNCMTGTEFFSRFPSLHGFLLEQFQQAQEAENASKPGVTVLHPSLFPSLLLLSRLYPSPNDANNSNMSMTPFLPYVIRAGCSAVYKTRSIAATALVPLVPPNQLVSTLHQLIDMLLGAANQPTPHPNAAHGILMQIHCLLEKYSKDTNLPHSVLDDITATVLPRFHQLMWLASSQNKSYVTRASFTAILKDFFVDTTWLHTTGATSCLATETTSTTIKGTVPKAFCSLLLNLILKLSRGEVCEGDLHAVSSSSCPGFPLWQATFASLCLKLRDTMLLMQTSSEQQSDERIASDSLSMAIGGMQFPPQQPQTHQLQHGQHESGPARCPSELGLTTGLHLYFLHSPFPEVRIVTLTHLIRIMEQSTCKGSDGRLEDTNSHIWVCHKEELMKQLMDMMMQEQDHECLAKICEVLSLLILEVSSPQLSSSSSPSSSLFEVEPEMFFRQCLDLAHENDAREEILSAVVSLTGAVLPLMDYPAQRADNDLSLFQRWASLMKSTSQTERCAQLRLAVARMFHHSAESLLGIVKPHIADIQLSLWGIVVALLQDDDDDVRHTAARCVMKTAPLMQPIQDFAEFTPEQETFLRKLKSALTDVDTCDNNEMKGTQPTSDWSVLLGLKEGPVTMDTMKTLAETYRRVYSILLSDEVDLVSWDLHPCLLLHVTPYLISRLHLRENSICCLATLISWVKEGARDMEPASTSDQDSEDRLFDKGEANTNSEDIQLRLASYLQLCRLQTQLQSTLNQDG